MKRRLLSLLMLLAAFLPLRLSAADTQQLTDEDYNRLMESGDAGRVVFIDFYADWCGPCHSYAPTFDALAEQYGRQAAFYRVNVDNCPGLVEKYNVSAVPLTVAVHSVDKSFRTIGELDMSALQSFIVRNLISYKADHPSER
ncbi:MAG: thioredoxin domain-containing protein [Duncaniella sp.]|nr:thioredoxin domain-containing protein [Duncaniella sp.]HBI58902.1 hypothetical protein [Porphyromonadaceae bacterium]